MSPVVETPLRKRSTSEKLDSSAGRNAATSQSASHAEFASTGRTGKVLLGLVSLTLSSYFIYDKLATSLSRNDPLAESYALCSREGAQQIYSVDPGNPRPECILVHQDKFISTGSLDHVRSIWHESSSGRLQVRHLERSQIVVPGLSDSHSHVLEYGATKQMPLEGTTSVAETVQRVKAYILADPDILNDKSKYVEGWGWDHTKWLLEEWPTYQALDADPIVAGRPVVLQSKDGHALWVSSAVLKAMEPLPKEIEGGVIVRDSYGEPTGVFLDNAQDLVIRPEPTHKQLQKRFAATVKDAHRLGLTSVHDAGFNPMSLEFFRREAHAGQLPIRVYGMKYFDETAAYWGDSFEKIILVGNNRLTVRSVKIFADGALRSGGAALYEPYTDNPETRGFMRISPELLNEVIPKFMKDGWQVNVHAIGDRANGVVLDAFEAALAEANVTALRPRLEHAQILAKHDMARFGDLGVIASVQPTHAISDMWFAEDRLGPERVKGLYAFRSILDHDARITLGSDFPVEDMNPLAGFYAAITRVSPEGTSPHGPGGWFPEQRMTREEALKGMTIDPAYASFTEDILGSITPGKFADFVVLSQDIMTVAPQKVLSTHVVATIIDGKPVYGTI
ncbi:amidohydrolase family-domain-containing protein [Dichomitus squalens]|uniref:Amidohydrolase family-domain-containing protein n=1 Tax=Dichomitus squalens TaxID=114155 RepID=A0A4Q9M7H6_9APHY|nr:amidohydrolase family-domain-containing protein [Dichomitus squalens]